MNTDPTQQIPQEGRPDPTTATEARIARGLQAERDFEMAERRTLLVRLDAMDKATALLSETVNRVPTEVTKEVLHVHGLVDEKFMSVSKQFQERDTRSERESRDNKVAVDAAFAAQKEAAAKQDESNQKAIDKSEKSTNETILKLAELFKTTTDALVDKIDDVKDRVNSIEANKVGRNENEQHHSVSTTTWIALAGVVLLAISIIVVALVAMRNGQHAAAVALCQQGTGSSIRFVSC